MIDIAILVVVMAGGALALKVLTAAGGGREDDEAWTTAARRLGGEVEIRPARFLRPAERRIRLTVEDIPVVVHTCRETDVRSDVYYTRVAAGPLPAARGTRIRCSKRDLTRKLSKLLHIGELPTGHAAFDDLVHVSGSPKSIVLAYLDGPTRALVADRDAGFDLDDAFLVVRREGVPSAAAPIVEMTRFAERLVQRWLALVRGPARLAESLALEADETPELGEGTGQIASGVHRSRPVTLALRVDDEIVLTVLSFGDPGAGDWAMERDEDDAFTTSGEPPEAVRAFARVAPESLLGMRRIAGTVEIAFGGLAPDHDEVATSLNALIDATTPLAPYR